MTEPSEIRIPPLLDVEVIRFEIRRLSSRIPAPHPLYLVDRGEFLEIDLSIILQDSKPSSAAAILFDISENGFGILSPSTLEVGTIITLCAFNKNAPEALFSEDMVILNRRLLSDTGDIPGILGTDKLWTYGMESQNANESTLYKATLDSIFISHIKNSTPLGQAKVTAEKSGNLAAKPVGGDAEYSIKDLQNVLRILDLRKSALIDYFRQMHIVAARLQDNFMRAADTHYPIHGEPTVANAEIQFINSLFVDDEKMQPGAEVVIMRKYFETTIFRYRLTERPYKQLKNNWRAEFIGTADVFPMDIRDTE